MRHHVNAWGRRLAALGLLVGLTLGGGCVSSGPGDQRVPRFQPALADDGGAPWSAPSAAVAPAPDGAPAGGPAQVSRVLKRGDRVVISLKGIPRPEDIQEVLDDAGEVNLPHIGNLVLEGLTTSEAENAIEKAYVDKKIYLQLTAIVMAQDQSYYIRGEVFRPGQYPLAKDTTLMMAITAAGGYTEYANRRRIRISRGDEVIWVNGNRIEAREDPDPGLRPNDIIVVESKMIL